MGKMRFGVWLPSFTWDDDTWVSARELREWCVRADHAGIDVWVIDHLLVAPGLYGDAWLEPMELSPTPPRSPSAWRSRRVSWSCRCATPSCWPRRSPPCRCRASIASCSASAPAGTSRSSTSPGRASRSGARTDELLAAVQALLENQVASYHGKYYQFDDVRLQPFIGKLPTSGGRWPRVPTRPTTQTSTIPWLHPSLRRAPDPEAEALALTLLRHAGVGQARLESQLRAGAQAGHDPEELTSATATSPISRPRRRAMRADATQREPFLRAMGSRRSFEHLCDCYMLDERGHHRPAGGTGQCRLHLHGARPGQRGTVADRHARQRDRAALSLTS